MFREQSIGFENILNALLSGTGHDKYPFYDIFSNKADKTYSIDIAVAGFKPSELSVYQEGELLIVKGNKEDSTEIPYFKSISKRSFKRSFMLGSNVVVDSVDLKYGILTIKLHEETSKDSKVDFKITE